MSETSPRLELPYMQPAQAQKHVTHNEALQMLDTLVQMVLQSIDAIDPPENPSAGALYHLGSGPTGVWTGQSDKLAVWGNGAWRFFTPHEGWRAWNLETQRSYLYQGGIWQFEQTRFDGLEGVGIGTGADGVNRLAVASDATLLTHASGGGHQLKLNKATVGDTASLLFQTGYDGRAEMGLAGEDAFSVKMRAAEGSWTQALRMDPVEQSVSLATGGGVQARLTQEGLAVDMAPGGVSDWRQVYDRSNVTGTVAQVAGEVTGALFESGENASGQYVKFADGTLICHRSVIIDVSIGFPQDFAYPASFISPPATSFAANSEELSAIGGSGDRTRGYFATVFGGGLSGWSARLQQGPSNTPGTISDFGVHLTAIGRWF
ncbi:DUF2793 domain-containing protein (plasmid) [Sulfitobacter sp. S223]|uniref:DUF2793 domain-containing protein n=1 Tax=Sulfitobacter sp. S223 TaxID=2867023 RepID=UPI0021A7A923|nr:DUF2793 domain-containing protein [Sulfitobacter sp. S223]UWR28331.1 DUF2793 domain-containing protein [Sulfitobacter sp. S223]